MAVAVREYIFKMMKKMWKNEAQRCFALLMGWVNYMSLHTGRKKYLLNAEVGTSGIF